MATLGVSVYPELRPMDEIAAYLAVAARHGYTRVFSSMFSMPGAPEEVLATFAELNRAAHACGMRVSLDVNPTCMARLGASPRDLLVFANIEADILRMDGAYGADDNVAMLQNPYGMQIEYNASALQPADIERLLAHGVDRSRILACHNFYPQRYTGFSWQKFVQVNERLGSLGIPIGAFVASHAPQSHGVWDATCGLTTVERLRDAPADLAARVLVAAGTTDVFFGNAYATEDELASVAEALRPVEPHYMSEEHRRSVDMLSSYVGDGVHLDVQHKVRVEPLYDLSDVEWRILFDYYPHLDMGDSSEWIWRSRGARQFFQEAVIPCRRDARACFEPGDVVMVNDNYKHYAGEVQVVLKPLVNDGTRNLVGRIDEQELLLFDVIRDGDVVVFLPARYTRGTVPYV